MLKRRVLTQENFDDLLAWLDPNRELGAIRYEEIRKSLIKIFAWRRCNNAEDLADETITRVAQKVYLLKATFEGDPAVYFYSVAKRLIREEQRKTKSQVPFIEGHEIAVSPADLDEPQDDRLYECLRSCLQQAGAENHRMILSYYVGERQTKIANRKAMAEQLGIPINALRVRMHRIRIALEDCIERCVRQSSADETK